MDGRPGEGWGLLQAKTKLCNNVSSCVFGSLNSEKERLNDMLLQLPFRPQKREEKGEFFCTATVHPPPPPLCAKTPHVPPGAKRKESSSGGAASCFSSIPISGGGGLGSI